MKTIQIFPATFRLLLICLLLSSLFLSCQNPSLSSGTYVKQIDVLTLQESEPYRKLTFSYRGNELEQLSILQASDEALLGRITYESANGLIQRINYYGIEDSLTHYRLFWYQGTKQLAKESTIFPDPAASVSSYGSEYLLLNDSTYLIKRLIDETLWKVDSLLLFPAQSSYRIVSEADAPDRRLMYLDFELEEGPALFGYLNQLVSPGIAELEAWEQHPFPIANSGQHPWLSGTIQTHTWRETTSNGGLNERMAEDWLYSYDDSERISEIQQLANISGGNAGRRLIITYFE